MLRRRYLVAVFLSVLLLATAIVQSNVANGQNTTSKVDNETQIKSKFDPKFYKKISSMIDAGENRYYTVAMLVPKPIDDKDEGMKIAKKNKDLLADVLEENHGAKAIAKGEILSFVIANVTVKEIPKLAKYDFVYKIGDGEVDGTPMMDVARIAVNGVNIPADGSGVKVGIIDTGIRNTNPSGLEHPDLPIPEKVVNQAVCLSSGCDTQGDVDDWLNHGTHTAGIIAGYGFVDFEMRGIALGASLVSAKLVDGQDTGGAMMMALDWLMQQGVDVVNISYGWDQCDDISSPYDVLNLVVDEAVDEGVTVVVASGNAVSGPSTIFNPACGYNVISVGGFNDFNSPDTIDDLIYDKSGRGPTPDNRMKPDLTAPAVKVYSTDWCHDYSDQQFKHENIPSCSFVSFGDLEGTSASAPFVSGAAADILNVLPAYTPLQVKAALLLGAIWNPEDTAGVPSTAMAYEDGGSVDETLNSWGFGSLDVNTTLTLARAGDNVITGNINQGQIYTYTLSATAGQQVKVILSWLQHPTGTVLDPLPVSISNLDLVVRDPANAVIANSSSISQNNEFAIFDAIIAGTYTLSVSAPFVDSLVGTEIFALASTHELAVAPNFFMKQGTFIKALSASPQLGRPVADITTGGWTVTPLWDKLDETPASDTDFVTSPSGTAPEFQVDLPNITDPTSSSGHVIKFRAKASTGSGPAEKANAILFQGTSQIAQTGLQTISRTAFSQITYTLTAAQADSITDYNNLNVRITTSKGNTEVIQVSWIEFEVPASPAINTVLDVGFQPKALILFTTGQTTEGFTDAYRFSIGYSDGTNSRSIGVASDDNVMTSNAGRAFGTKLLRILSSGSPTLSAEADLIGFLPSGFSIRWTTNDSVAAKIHYIALGGPDLTNSAVSSFIANTVTGPQSVPVGFKPDFLMFMHAGDTAESGNPAHGYLSYGFAMPSKMAAIAVASVDVQKPPLTREIQRTDRAIVTITESTGAIDAEATLTTMDTNGFTINWADSPASADKIYYLALKGGRYDVGSFGKSTTLTPPAVSQTVPFTNSDFTPAGLILSSFNNLANTAVQSNNRLSFGATDGNEESANWAGDSNGGQRSVTARSETAAKVIRTATEQATGSSSTINAEADIVSLASSGFTLSWSTNNAVQTEIIYAAFGGQAPRTISGYVFDDANDNGIDDSETRLSKWIVRLFKEGLEIQAGATDSQGSFSFTGLLPGTYTISEDVQSGWINTTPSTIGPIDLTTTIDSVSNKFGNFKFGQISGIKYNDTNGDGTQNAGELGLQDWTIELRDSGGSLVSSMNTDSSGAYSFSAVRGGTFTVSEVLTSGYVQTAPAAGTFTINVLSGTISVNNDFGNKPTQANPAFGVFLVTVAPGLVLDYSSGMGGYVTFTQTQLQIVDPSTFAVTTFPMPTISAGGLYTGMDCLGSSCAFVVDMNTGSHRLIRLGSSGQVLANVTVDSAGDLAGFLDNGDIVFDSTGIYVWAQCDDNDMVVLRLDSNFVETGRIGDCAGINLQNTGSARDMMVSGTRLAVTTDQGSGINTFQLWNIDGSLVCRFNAGIYTSGTGQITRANNLWYVARSTGIDIISDSCVDTGDITQAQMGISTAIREVFAYTSRDELMVVATNKVSVMNLTSVNSKLYDWPTGDIGQPYKAIGAPEVNQFATLSGTTLKIVQLGSAIEHHNVATGESDTFTLAYNAFTDSYITLDASFDSEAIVKVSATAFTAVSNNLDQDLGTGAYAPNHGVQCVQTSDRCVVGWDSPTDGNDRIRVVSTTGATLGTVSPAPRTNPNQVSGISGTTLYMPIQCSASDGDVIIQVYSISGAPSLTGEIGDCAGISVGNTGVKELTVSGTKIGLTTGSATNGFQIWNTAGGRVCTANVASVTHARDETALRWYLSTGSGTIQIYDDSCADVGDITTGQHGITGSIRQVDINTNRDELYIVGDSGVAVMNLTTPSQLLYTVPVGDSGVSLWHNFAVSTGFDQFANLVSNVVQIRVLN